MVKRPLIKPETREHYPASPKLSTSSIELTFFRKLLNIEIPYKKYLPRKFITSCLPTETKASSTVLNCGDVAQMVERLLCMREVRGAMPRIFKTRATHQKGNHYLQIIYCILKFLTSRFSANEKKKFIVAD